MQKDVGRMFGGWRERGIKTKLKTENKARRFWPIVRHETTVYPKLDKHLAVFWWGEGIWQQLLLSKTEVVLFFLFSVDIVGSHPPLNPRFLFQG